MAGLSVPNGSGFFAGSGDISVIPTGINGIMAGMQFTNDTALYSAMCFVDNGATTNGTPIGRAIAGVNNGSDGQAGEIMHYPLSPVSNAPEKWPFGVPAASKDVTIVDVAVQRDRTYVPIEKIYLDKQDPYQVLAAKQGQIASRMLRAPDFDLAELINSNATTLNYFDGLSFFNTAHPISPGSTVTFSNDITCTIAEWESGEGLSKLLDAFASIPWFDGKLKDGTMSKPLIVTSNMRFNFKARQLAGLITSLVGPAIVGTAAGGAQHSPFTGMVRDVVNFQDLQNVTKYPNSGKYVYALATTGGSVQPAFIMSPKRWPYMTIYGTDPNEEIRRTEGAIGWNWSGYWGVGFGLPQCAVRMKIV